MTKEEFKKLKETVDYFGHWYDVIGEERVSILEKSIKYIEELEQINSETITQLNRDNGELIIENEKLHKDNEELKKHIENIYANHCGNCNRNILNTKLKKENKELEKNYQDSLVAYKFLKDKVELLAQPSLYENMQDALIATQKAENEKLRKELSESKLKLEALDDNVPWAEIKDKSEVIGKLTEAKEIIKELLDTQSQLDPYRNIFKDRILKAEQFLRDSGVEK